MVARGTKNGNVQIFNLFSTHLIGEYSVHTNAVVEIKWLGIDRIISNSISTGSTADNFLNTVTLLNIHSGRSTIIRHSKTEEAAIDKMIPSQSSEFMLITFKQSHKGNGLFC